MSGELLIRDTHLGKWALKVNPFECYVEIKPSHIYKNMMPPMFDVWVNQGCVACLLTYPDAMSLYHKIQDSCSAGRKDTPDE